MGFLAESSAIGWSDLSSVLSAITGQISVTTVIAVLAGAIGAAIGLVFMWWGVRKVRPTNSRTLS